MTPVDRNNLIADGVKKLLDQAPIYGNIILKLGRVMDAYAKAPLGLRWQSGSWQLVVNPRLVRQQYATPEQMALALAHEALHMIWQHPTRYANVTQRQVVVDYGTDVAVNQYLPTGLGTLPNLVTRQSIWADYGIQLASHQDSAVYITELAQHDVIRKTSGGGDEASHAGWQNIAGDLPQAQSALVTLVQQATVPVNSIGRGQLPVPVQRALAALTTPLLPWRALLNMGRHAQPDQHSPTRTRFNRRQPYRLDLLGTTPRYSPQLAVFIDQSASISDAQLQVMQAYGQQIVSSFGHGVQLYAFDSIVQPLSSAQYLTRVANGGTTFQSIFDALQRKKLTPKDTKVVIFTDGAGETTPLKTAFQDVFWVLPPDQALSIQAPFGTILPLL